MAVDLAALDCRRSDPVGSSEAPGTADPIVERLCRYGRPTASAKSAERRRACQTEDGTPARVLGIHQATAALLLRLWEAARSSPVFGSRLIATQIPSPPNRALAESCSR